MRAAWAAALLAISSPRGLDWGRDMTLEQIKEELARMPEEQQDHVVGYVMHLRRLRDPLLRQELTRKMEDRDPSHWISVDQLKECWKD